MTTYKTIDGELVLKRIGNGLLQNQETGECYESRLCKPVRKKRKRIPTLMVEVHYWTKRDDDTLHCMPSGRRRVYFYGVSDKYEACRRVESRKQFRRADGTSRIYYIEC